jgi:hypothetical protein
MGWTAVEPLSPGFFQIDPSVMTLDAEGNRVFHAGAGGASKALIKKIWLAAKQTVKDAVQATIKAFVKKDVAVKISDEVGEDLTAQAMKNVDKKTFPSGMTGEELSKQNPGSWMAAVKRETGDLASKQIDDLAESTKGGLKDVVGEGGEITLRKGGAEVTEVGVKEVPESLVDDVVPTKELSPRGKALKDSADKLTQKGLFYGALATTAVIILTPLTEALGEGFGDVVDNLTGEPCQEIDDAEEKDRCEDKAQQKLLLVGAAGVGLVGLFGALIITRLIPKAKTDTDGDGIADKDE